MRRFRDARGPSDRRTDLRLVVNYDLSFILALMSVLLLLRKVSLVASEIELGRFDRQTLRLPFG